TVVCFACGLCAAVSLFRREAHRRLSIAILIISCLVVAGFGPIVIRAVNGLRRQHAEVARSSQSSQRSPADSVSPTADKTSSAPLSREVQNPQILKLKTKLWEAIRTKDADAFVGCF